MSEKTIAEILMAKVKYEEEIGEFLRLRAREFTEETSVSIQEISIGIERIQSAPTGLNLHLYRILDLTLELDWEGTLDGPLS